MSSNLCEGLVRLNADLGVEMGLAESIETPDDLTMIFNLRPGVAFTNGDPLTPEDVVYSLKRHMDPSVGSFWAYYYDSVKSIEATGPAQVTVKFTEHSALFEQWMGTVGGYISQKSYAERAGKEYGTPAGGVMCTGPFSLQSWRSGESITLLRNENYWDPGNSPRPRSLYRRMWRPGSSKSFKRCRTLRPTGLMRPAAFQVVHPRRG